MPTVLSRARHDSPDVSPIDASLRALADPTRRDILLTLRNSERAAGDIAARYPEISRPAVSQHLRVLEGAALVVVRRDGNRRLYRARTEGLDTVQAFLDQMWSGALDRLKVAAERAERERRERGRAAPKTNKKGRR